jgi:hypothetical protein
MTESRKDLRVPIPLSQEVYDQLEKVRKGESRSRQSMAGIIFHLGMRTYLNSEGNNNKSQ